MNSNTKKNWIKSMGWLLMVVSFLITPATLVIPTPTMAADAEIATTEPTQFGPSTHLPLLLNNDCSGTRPASNPFGVQLYGPLFDDLKEFNVLQNSRSSWVRNSIEWGLVEPDNREPATYRWDRSDRIARIAPENCVNLIATIDTTPEWATIGDARSPFQTNLLPEFVQFMGAVVERYDGDGIDDAPNGMVVKYWEIYNEPDAGSSPTGGGWGEYGTRYAEMLKAIYPVVKAADPEAQIVIGGLAHDNFTDGSGGGVFVREFLANVLAAGGGDAFDIMNIHYYPFNSHRQVWTDSKSSGLVEKIAELEGILAEHDVTKPLMITEIGWHSNVTANNPSSENFQARHVVQLFTQSLAADAIAAIWWPLFDSITYQFKSGLANESADVKSSYAVYIEALKRIGEAQFVRVVVPATAGNDLEVYEFREAGTNKVLFVAWLNPIAPFTAVEAPTYNDNATQPFQALGNVARVYTKEGTLKQTVQDTADGADDNNITITVGTDPIYIVID